MMETVPAAERSRRGDDGLAAELKDGAAEGQKQEAMRGNRERQDVKKMQDILRLTEEMNAIQAVIDEEQALVAQREKMQNASAEAAPIHAKVIAAREEAVRQARIKLPANLANSDIAGLEAAFLGKKAIKEELEGQLETVAVAA